MDFSWIATVALVCYIVRRLWGLYANRKRFEPVRIQRDLTLEAISLYDGRDPFRALLVAVKGTIYDVSEDQSTYGPGGKYHVYSGKECARALGMMSTKVEDCNDNLKDLPEFQREDIEARIKEFEAKYPVYGKVVPEKTLTEEQLLEYDGSDPKKPMYMAIKGTIFDVTKAPQFYGPDGIYPFAGRECARAMALYSTELEDCTKNVDGLDASEIDALNDWYAKFVSKYDIVGNII